MKKNVAVYLWDNTFKFFNFKKKKIATFTYEQPVFCSPINIGEYLYILSQLETADTAKEGISKTISKIGNNYGVFLEIAPKHIQPKGKSLKINLKNINLIQPRYEVEITNRSGEIVYTKTITWKDNSTFAWIPEKAEEFKIKVEINSLNKKGMIIETSAQIIDLEKMLKNHYFFLQKQSTVDQLDLTALEQ